MQPRRADALDPHHDAIRALALLAHLDKARHFGVPHRRRQHRVLDDGAFARGGGKAGRCCRDAERRGKCDRPLPQHDGGQRRGGKQRDGRPQLGLPVGGEIDDNAAAERDREPGHQPARRDLRQHPFANTLGKPAGKAGEVFGPGKRGPSSGCAPWAPYRRPPARSVLVGHCAATLNPRYN